MIKFLKKLLGSSGQPQSDRPAQVGAPETDQVRQRSRATVKALGFPDPTPLPSLDEMKARDTDQIVRRLFTLSVVLAAVYGFETERAKEWLIQEELIETS